MKLPRLLSGARCRLDGIYGDIAHLVAAHGDYPPGLTAYEYRVFSQNGEDGVIAEIFQRAGVTNRYFVEFGICEGTQGNAVFLADVMGWQGLFVEPDPALYVHLATKYRHHPRVATASDAIAPVNVEEVFDRCGVPESFDLLSIDIDGNDYWVWEALDRFRPRVVVIEYNGTLPAEERLVQPYSTTYWDGSDYYGASIGALRFLAEKKGYKFVHTDLTGNNAFFVADKLQDRFADLSPPVGHTYNQNLLATTHRSDKARRRYVIP